MTSNVSRTLESGSRIPKDKEIAFTSCLGRWSLVKEDDKCNYWTEAYHEVSI